MLFKSVEKNNYVLKEIMKRLNNLKKLRLAIPNKGRMMEPVLELLKDMGLQFDMVERRLFSPCINFNLDLLFLRASDIPKYVENGFVDIGITGSDLVVERNSKVKTMIDLNIGKCSLILAIPNTSKIKSINELNNKRVATSFPCLTKKFFVEKKVKVKIVEVEGATEITPWLGVADAITDLVSTGESLRLHNLSEIENIFNSEAVLISSVKIPLEKQKDLNHFLEIVRGVLNGRSKKYLMMNAPEKILDEIKRIIPGLKSPTVLKLAKPGMIAIHSVVDENIIWEIIPKLKAIGASGILVSPIEKLIY